MDMENITDIYETVNLGPCPCEVWVGIGKGCCGWKRVGGVGNKGEQNENEEIVLQNFTCVILFHLFM